MISIQHQDCPQRGKRRRIRVEFAGLIGVIVWFAIAYVAFHR